LHVPQPSGARPASASAETGSRRSTPARMRKYDSWSSVRKASRIATSASVAGSHSDTFTSPNARERDHFNAYNLQGQAPITMGGSAQTPSRVYGRAAIQPTRQIP